MCPIFLDDGVDELLSRGSTAQQAYTALELRHEWHGVPDQVPSLDRCVPHLPTCKFPVNDVRIIMNVQPHHKKTIELQCKYTVDCRRRFHKWRHFRLRYEGASVQMCALTGYGWMFLEAPQ